MVLPEPANLKFPPVQGHTVRADFDGGAMSSDIGPLILRGVDKQTGLSAAIAAAIHDWRHPSYIEHPLQDLIAQRVYQIACRYEDANDANSLRRDPIFKLALERFPLGEDNHLASAATFSRLENGVSRTALYRIARAFVDQFIASYAEPPEALILDMDHSVDPTHGTQQLTLFNAHYDTHCYLPLFVFEGLSGKLITAVLRPGKRPTGAENAMIIRHILKYLRRHWPETHIVLRGDSHFANPELMKLALTDPACDFIFGVSGNSKLTPLAAPALAQARRLHETRQAYALRLGWTPPHSTRVYEEVDYTAGTWPPGGRVILKAEVMDQGENPRFVVTSLTKPSPEMVYEQLYCARGQDENYIKYLKNDLASDRTSDHSFQANQMRLFFACAAYNLHLSLRQELLQGTELADAQPSTVILKLFKLAVRVMQFKDRVKLHLPSSCPVKAILVKITQMLYLIPLPKAVLPNTA
jgi:hypothetical protein